MSEKYEFSELEFAVRKWIVMSLFEYDQEKYQKLLKNEWIVDVEEAQDGSGDAILTFPNELTLLQGWKEGTVLDFESKDGKIIVKAAK